jgi:hypothetical protein
MYHLAGIYLATPITESDNSLESIYKRFPLKVALEFFAFRPCNYSSKNSVFAKAQRIRRWLTKPPMYTDRDVVQRQSATYLPVEGCFPPRKFVQAPGATVLLVNLGSRLGICHNIPLSSTPKVKKGFQDLSRSHGSCYRGIRYTSDRVQVLMNPAPLFSRNRSTEFEREIGTAFRSTLSKKVGDVVY